MKMLGCNKFRSASSSTEIALVSTSDTEEINTLSFRNKRLLRGLSKISRFLDALG